MLPIDISTAETMTFIESHTPTQSKSILEVGCGKGHLAAALKQSGANVLALDTSVKAIEHAQSLGVDAIVSDFLDYNGPQFDIVLFTRSLHHIHPLKRAVEKAKSLLVPGGLILIEDFDIAIVDAVTAAWRYNSEALLNLAGCTTEGEVLPTNIDPLEAWKRKHYDEHKISTGDELVEALSAAFSSVTQERTTYLYRYVVRVLEETDRGGTLADRLLQCEKQALAMGIIKPVGLRLVCR